MEFVEGVLERVRGCHDAGAWWMGSVLVMGSITGDSCLAKSLSGSFETRRRDDRWNGWVNCDDVVVGMGDH